MKPYYQDDAVTLFHGDALDVLATLESVDHVITDPPYARDVYVRASAARPAGTPHDGRRSRNKAPRIVALAAGDIGSIDEILEDVAAEYARIVRRWTLVFSDVETCHLWRSALVFGGLRYIRTGAWVKTDPMPQFSGDRPCVGFEPATICHARGPMRWNGGGSAARWDYGTAKGDTRPDHPCPKPLALALRLVDDFTDPGETVLDTFAGSGTTGAACKALGRKVILVEREERHCETTARRMETVEPLWRPGRARGKQLALVSEGGGLVGA